MKTKAETGKPQFINTLLLGLATALMVAAVGAYYWLQDLVITPVRVVGLIAVVGIASFIAAQADAGAAFFRFLKEADIERRKVVWPTHQETMQTAFMVIIVIILIALFLAGVDWLLGAAVRMLVGS